MHSSIFRSSRSWMISMQISPYWVFRSACLTSRARSRTTRATRRTPCGRHPVNRTLPTRETSSTLITLGGDHGVPIPVMRALEVFGKPITLVHVDAHLDWRHEVNSETESYSSSIRRAAEMPWIDTYGCFTSHSRRSCNLM